ncbi:hypothetical protein BA190_10305 [Labrys sp. WJW]|uniref:hypothetical protein n=1 Tax=Labrys sp. WJW TaxID=1737983 RepID=UPI00082DE444|nr:hypothetical protein [Labrys sp. WJW]OCC05286.1 hypothetical protein BA190_10305 [Labrys sp. WJW]
MPVLVAVMMHMFFSPRAGGLNYCVEDWGRVGEKGRRYETIAACDGIMMARRAFGVAVEERPRNHILLRHGCRVVQDSENPEDRNNPLNYPERTA